MSGALSSEGRRPADGGGLERRGASPILSEWDGAVCTITLNRPNDGNRLDHSLLEELASQLAQADARDEIAVIVLRARGDDFSLGRAQREYQQCPALSEMQTEFAPVLEVNRILEASAAVTIAGVAGPAVGAGAGLAGRCDLVLAARSATFAFPELTYGMVPTIVGPYFLRRLGRTPVLDLILTGRSISAREAQAMGLVSRVVDDEDCDKEVGLLARHIAAFDVRAVRSFKRFLHEQDDCDVASDRALEVIHESVASRWKR